MLRCYWDYKPSSTALQSSNVKEDILYIPERYTSKWFWVALLEIYLKSLLSRIDRRTFSDINHYYINGRTFFFNKGNVSLSSLKPQLLHKKWAYNFIQGCARPISSSFIYHKAWSSNENKFVYKINLCRLKCMKADKFI